MDMEDQVKLYNPWLSIWVKPRETIRWIAETDPRQHIILLAVLSGIAQSLSRAAGRSAGDTAPLIGIFVFAFIAGSIGGIISVYVGGAILRWIGSLFGGEATSEEVRAAIAWSSIPAIWGLLLWIPELLLFGEELFKSVTPRIDSSPVLIFLLFGFGIVEIVIGIWALIIFLLCLGEVHRFSVWKALLTVILPVFAIAFFVIGCLLLLGPIVGDVFDQISSSL